MPSHDEQEFILPESGSKALIADCQSTLAVIVTHPWGPLGGNMNNNVVMGICFWFQRLRITTMRFDFCGSQIGRGFRQVLQVEEAAKFLLGEEHLSPQEQGNDDVVVVVPKYILLVGYSYGSIISASASASIPTCIGVVSIAPPLAVRHWLYVFHGNYHLEQAKKRKDLPRLMVIGSDDNFTSEEMFQEVVKKFPEESTTGAVLKGANHFFKGREKELIDILGKEVDECQGCYWQGCYCNGMNDRAYWLKGQWLVSAFPQCNGNLKSLRDVDFSQYEAPLPNNVSLDKSMSVDEYVLCNPCAGPGLIG